MAKPEPADRALQGHTELRDRIEAAMRRDDFSITTMTDAVMPLVEAETAALRQRAEKAERERDQAEAAVRRVRQALAWKTLLAGPQAEKAVRVADVEAALTAEPPTETPAVQCHGDLAES